MRGLSFSDFANENLDLAAAEALQQCPTIVLSERDMSAFVEALLHPDEPDERSKRYARLHLEVLGAQEAPDWAGSVYPRPSQDAILEPWKRARVEVVANRGFLDGNSWLCAFIARRWRT